MVTLLTHSAITDGPRSGESESEGCYELPAVKSRVSGWVGLQTRERKIGAPKIPCKREGAPRLQKPPTGPTSHPTSVFVFLRDFTLLLQSPTVSRLFTGLPESIGQRHGNTGRWGLQEYCVITSKRISREISELSAGSVCRPPRCSAIGYSS